MAGITLDMFNFKLPLLLEPEKNWHNADNEDDDDDVVDIRSGLPETGSALLSRMIYAACLCSRLCVHGSQLQTKKNTNSLKLAMQTTTTTFSDYYN